MQRGLMVIYIYKVRHRQQCIVKNRIRDRPPTLLCYIYRENCKLCSSQCCVYKYILHNIILYGRMRDNKNLIIYIHITYRYIILYYIVVK